MSHYPIALRGKWKKEIKELWKIILAELSFSRLLYRAILCPNKTQEVLAFGLWSTFKSVSPPREKKLGTPASTVEAEPSSSVLLNSSKIATHIIEGSHSVLEKVILSITLQAYQASQRILYYIVFVHLCGFLSFYDDAPLITDKIWILG